MKRIWIFLLLLALTACGAAPVEKPGQATPPAETEPVMPEAPEPAIRYETELLRVSDVRQTEDGETLLNYEVQIPVLTALRADGTVITADGQTLTGAEEQAMAVAAGFNEAFVGWTDDKILLDLEEMAQEDLNWHREEGFDWYDGYLYELTCSVYQAERMISISGLHVSYTGGAHPNSYQLGWNFDLETGTFFDAEALTDGTELRSVVAAEIIRQAQMPGEDGLIPAEDYWPDYETLVSDWPRYAVFFDETGMTVEFSPYELAPYAFGPQQFRFSYEWLEPYLGDHGRTLLGLE